MHPHWLSSHELPDQVPSLSQCHAPQTLTHPPFYFQQMTLLFKSPELKNSQKVIFTFLR